MKLIPKIVVVLLFCCCLTPLFAQDYAWPTDASEFMTSAFGEFRVDRFHAGIDIKTWNRTGYKAIAVEDGYVYRIKTNPGQGGKALYIKLRDGNIAVYYHLQKYAPHIQDIVKNEQKRRGKYSIELWPGTNTIPVKKGEIIAYTGRSGTRLPHLHFELRDANNRPLNPLENGFKAQDDAAPVPTKLSFRPMNVHASAEGDWAPVIRRLRWNKKGFYELPKPVKVWGDIGLSLDAYDMNGHYDNKYGIYALKLIVDGKEVFSSEYDRFSFVQNRQLNIDRDYAHLRRDKGKFQKLYVDEGNTLSFYGNYKRDDGILTFDGESPKQVSFEIIVSDFYGNKSTVKGRFRSEPVAGNALASKTNDNASQGSGSDGNGVESALPGRNFVVGQDFQDEFLRLTFSSRNNLESLPTVKVYAENQVVAEANIRAKSRRSFVAAVPFDDIENKKSVIVLQGFSKTHEYTSKIPFHVQRVSRKGTTVRLPSGRGSLRFISDNIFSDFWIKLDEEVTDEEYGDNEIVGSIIHLVPQRIPFKSSALLTVNYPPDDQLPQKLGVYARDDDGDWHFLNNRINRASNSISFGLRSLETIAVLRDTIPPEIYRVQPAENAALSTERPTIIITADDALSGIGNEDDIALYLNDKKVIAEWDVVRDRILYRPDEALPKGEYTAKIAITDRSKNKVEKVWKFTIR